MIAIVIALDMKSMQRNLIMDVIFWYVYADSLYLSGVPLEQEGREEARE